MTRRKWSFIAIAVLVIGIDLKGTHGDGLPKQVVLLPEIGAYLWLVEEYMATAWYGSFYETGALTVRQFYEALADVDSDGVEELIIMVDHDAACEWGTCDVFIFAPENDDDLASTEASNWRLMDRLAMPVKRSLRERFVTFGDQTVTLQREWAVLNLRLEGMDQFDYFAEVLGLPFKVDEILLSHVRVGTYDVNGDGREEVFIYVVSPPICESDECGGAVLELLPSEDGSLTDWRWIGELTALDPAMHLISRRDAFVWPGRTMRVIDETVDGYASLCSSRSYLRWNGDTYDIDFGLSREESEALGCPILPY